MKTFYPLKTIFYFFFLLILFLGCSKEEASPIEEPLPEEETFNYSSSAEYNLNVVYFLPTDVKERKDSHRRLSEILLHGQAFYRKYMKEYGFGDKTFNMLVDRQRNV